LASFPRLNLGQTYVDDRIGDLARKFDKKNVPTMGGLIIFAAVFSSTLLWTRLNVWVLVSLFVYLLLTIAGFRDDYLKVVRRSRDGIRPLEKILWQTLATGGALAALLWHPESAKTISQLWVPFCKTVLVPHMPWWLLCGMMFVWVVGFSNAINVTDGLDGLATGATISVTLVLGAMAYVASNVITADYLLIGHVRGCEELTVLCGALIGACMAFLWFNSHPAEVFMGDTGSLAIGGLLGIIAFMIQQPLTLFIIGGVFWGELASSGLQISWFKLTRWRTGEGRRIFLCAPAHHHFQKKGWPETKVVLRFWVISLACALAGLATLKIR
ncbi:MAG: phospho-N-acetylmuramoyl-pentapeptide-transferase, partial [Opitutaceae bacterium]|nr:phospho-N-acetylmuramoyl-pentapeptide-transferase [Opitutaceae bacterium]